MQDSFVTVYDPYRPWTVIPEALATLAIIGFAVMAFREQVVAPRRRGERPDFGGVLGVLVAGAIALAVTSQVPTPAWAVVGGPAQVVEGPVRDVVRRDKPMGRPTLDFMVDGVPVHLYGEGRRLGLVNLPPDRGGPIREGLWVRVSLRAGKVLKFEVRE